MDYQVPGSMMDEDGDIKDDSKRKTRNLSEKKRRDQFNQLVTELSTLVCSNNRKMNKSSVLKSTLTFLKNHNELTVRSRAHDVQEDWKPSFLSNEEFTYLVLEALEGFVMVFSANGRIYYVSESISSLLGHNPVEIINKNIFDLIFEEDRPNLFNLLQNNAIAIEQNPNFCIENEVIKFNAHLRRGNLDFKEEVSYDLVHFYGHCRTNQEHVDANREVMDYQNAESSILFVCIGRVQTPQLICDVSLVDSFRNEFTSRHSLEWKFLYLDHRAPPIIGYLPFEVLGTSGYDYYHFDDLEKVVSCHEALMQKGEVTSCYYRFLTKGQQWIWLQSRFYITYHQWNAKPEFVVCTHRVVSYADVVKGTKEENLELDTDTEAEATQNDNLLETPSEDLLPVLSPSSISEAASDAFANSYQPIPQVASDVQMPSLSPSYTAVSVSDDFGNIFQLVSQNTLKVASPELPCPSSVVSDLSSHDSLMTPFPEERLSPEVKNTQIDSNIIFNASTSQNSINGASSDVCVESPTNILEVADDAFNDCTRLQVRPVSACSISVGSTAGAMATAATSSTTWPSARNVYASGAGDSDTGSLSGESRSSQRNSEREPPYTLDGHLELLESGGYAGGVLPLSTLPTHGAPDNAQMQHQIQRKHEELQQMIVRQQEELRQVKEQLLLARLGILQPLINMPIAHSTPEELQNQQRLAAAAGIAGYPPGTSQPTLVALLPMSPNPPHPSQPPHSPQPPHPSQPPQTSHPSDPHQQMPQ